MVLLWEDEVDKARRAFLCRSARMPTLTWLRRIGQSLTLISETVTCCKRSACAGSTHASLRGGPAAYYLRALSMLLPAFSMGPLPISLS
jgi:hypothetical protein